MAERLSPRAESVLAEMNRHPSGVSGRPVSWDIARELEHPQRAIQLPDGRLRITEEGRRYIREKH